MSVTLRETEDAVGFEVADDGPGFDPPPTYDGAGILNMRDRLGALGGELSILTSPGGGTRVVGSVPLRDSESSGREPVTTDVERPRPAAKERSEALSGDL